MTNVNKHGVDYSEIEIGDLVKLDMGWRGTILGYVTGVTDSKLHAIWSDDFEEWFEDFSTGKIVGHWKVVIHKNKPTKPYAQLVSYNSSVLGRKKWGLFSHMDGNDVWAYWEGWSNEHVSLGTTHIRDIIDIVDVVVHEPKKLVPTKPYKQLVAYDFLEKGILVWGVFTGMDGNNVKAHWNSEFHYSPNNFMPLDRIVAVEDIIIHEPKEQNLSDAQELSVQQEAANFAHVAVQGIINAHALKEMEDSYESRLKQYEVTSKPVFTFDDFDLSVRRTWKKQDFKDAVSNAALGLTGEAGEVADLIKKGIYHGRGWRNCGGGERSISEEDVKDELSDVLFYVSAMAQEFGFTLEDVAKHNRKKLEKRFPEGFSTEASAQKVDRAPEVKPDGEIRIGYVESYKEDTLEYVGVDKAPFSTTYFSTDYELKKTLKELRDGSRVTIEDKHKGEFKFTRVGDLIRVQFKDLEGNLDSHTCLVKVSYGEVTN
ncbi:nucleoside triphosphate pyrophosphohydrolase family protein [Bacillus cereus]